MLVQNTFQYKQCLCILTLPKCNDLHNLQTRQKLIKCSYWLPRKFLSIWKPKIPSNIITSQDYFFIVHIGVSTHPQKHRRFLFTQPPLNLHTVESPFFRQFIPIYCFFPETAIKNLNFQWTPLILIFFILNPILSFKSS